MPAASNESPGKAPLLRSLRDEQRSARRWQDLLTISERQAMLADIARVALAIGQDLYPQQNLSDVDVGAAAPGRGDVCPRERLAFLMSVWPRLSNALRIIETAPATILIPGVREARIEQGSLKRVSQSAISAALRSGDFIAVPASAGPLARRLQGRLPRRIAETAAIPSSDTPVNRAVKAILVQIVHDLSRIAALADITEAPDVTLKAEKLRNMIRDRLRREPWHHLPLARVQSAYPPSSGPAYRYFFDQWRRYRNSFAFDWVNPLFTLPSRETWLLYEYSCLFTVAGALRDLGFQTASADGFALSRSGLTFSLEKGRRSRLVFQREGGQKVMLHYNPDFPRKEKGRAHDWCSRSHSLRPDIALEADGRLLIFDAKFKTYAEPVITEDELPAWHFRDGALLPDIQQMHTYRDAIVHGDHDNVVSEAWLLYAGRLHVANPAVVAYPQPTGAEPFGTGKIGAILLRPGIDPEPLRSFLHRFFTRRSG